MTEFTYVFPESRKFLHTLITYLQAKDKDNIVNWLIKSKCEFLENEEFGYRYYSREATVKFLLPHDVFTEFKKIDTKTQIEKDLLCAVKKNFPSDAGYDITYLEILPVIEAPPDEEINLENSASLVSPGNLLHDGLRFRSRSEIKIYEVLKKRNVLFFANATAVLGSKDIKKEPDFLVCQNGKWGILEVMGEPYHPSSTAMKDHERARLFKNYGLLYIEFYDAARCYSKPDEVVDDFLHRLSSIQ
ncbi:hypothetical protein [Calothrix sp. UHCC 0171]|uniref:hypothetical protein n=1 Tax=Calothrix sp. UHCC 0171 TaxID=3110245 RepID=UPI002B1EE98C|nr:hypothetical protein [Calothrix sp. UHCC 0171]MEA5572654.1 hypothetical protein [Calothrix sp. UHCC 0171]